MLIDNGTNVTPLHLSAMNGCFAEFEEKKIINFSGHTENVNLFITRGAYVNAEENTEIPPLQMSSSNSCFAQ